MATTTTIFLKGESALPHSPMIPHTPPQSIIEAEAEAEAEAEMFRRQAYAIRGLVYPGPRRITHKRPSVTKASSTPSAKRPKSLGAGQAVSAAPSKLSPAAPAEESFVAKEPSFARLIEDLLRTHSSTASPYGQHLSHSILNDSNKVYLGNFYGGIGPN